MDLINQCHELAAVALARVFLGLLFFFQGYDVVVNVKIKTVIDTYQNTFRNKGIPKSLTVFAAWFTSITALLGGICLTLGLFEYFTLYLLSVNLLVASIGFGINTAMWDTRFVFPRLLLLLFLLIVPESWNLWSLDSFLF